MGAITLIDDRSRSGASSICAAGEGSSETVISVGDKGRSQLTRTEGKTFALAVGDTYKVRVTFPQVRQLQVHAGKS